MPYKPVVTVDHVFFAVHWPEFSEFHFLFSDPVKEYNNKTMKKWPGMTHNDLKTPADRSHYR